MKKSIIILFFFVSTFCLFARDKVIRGTVVDTNDEPLIAVSIVVTGNTYIGTLTDMDGNFSLTVPENTKSITFSYVGFEKQVVTLKPAQTVINIKMQEDTKVLSDVVVVGYGTQQKASIVGAISNISNEQLKVAAPSNLTNAIAGRITGAVVRMSDGNIGGGTDRYSNDGTLADAQIFIRGKATTNSASPLIIVDGVESSFSNINPEDIAQFSVLKDASATAVYGVRGANGVILITTKEGQIGKPKVSVKAEIRMHKPLAFPEFLGAYDYAVLYNEALKNMGSAPKYSDADIEHWRTGDDPYGHPDVDWRDILVKDHFYEQQYSFNLNGGTEKVRYYVSGEYLHSGGPFYGFDLGSYTTNSYYKRFNLRTNFDFSITKTTSLNVKLSTINDKKNDPNHDDSSGARYMGSFWWDIVSLPNNEFPIYNPDGSLAYGRNYAANNVYANLVDGGYYQRMLNRFQTNITLNQKLDFITKGLSFRAMYGNVFNYGSTMSFSHMPALWRYNVQRNDYSLITAETMPEYSASTYPSMNRIHVESALDYSRLFGLHRVGAMAIYIQTMDNYGYALPTNYRGVSGRMTYSYADRYLFEFNAGYNGSDKFSKGNRYAFLPSFSAGWILSNEEFMKEAKQIDNLKVRGSFGTVGNDKIGSFKYLYRYEYVPSSGWDSGFDAYTYRFGAEPQETGKGLREGTIGNDKVTWEIAKKYNVGVDLSAFGQKLNVTVDLFKENRKNILLIRQDIPTQTGLLTGILPAENAGRVSNKGFEVSASYSDKIGNLGYSLGGNFTFARNNIDYIAEVEKRYPYQMQKNHPIGQVFGYTWTGKFYDFADLEDPTVPKPSFPVYPGDLIFKDLNGDNIIDDYDKGAIGFPSIPEIIYGFNVGLSYKNFSANFFFQGASNVSSYYGQELTNEFVANVQERHLGRWVYDPEKGLDTRATATYPALQVNGGSTSTKAVSTFNVFNTAYLRLKSTEIAYEIKSKELKQNFISSIRVYMSASNPLTFTRYKHIDPEYTTDSKGPYFPQTQFYSLGLNVNF
jgi:TonB-linked SusC/RagA family outer membrane protein